MYAVRIRSVHERLGACVCFAFFWYYHHDHVSFHPLYYYHYYYHYYLLLSFHSFGIIMMMMMMVVILITLGTLVHSSNHIRSVIHSPRKVPGGACALKASCSGGICAQGKPWPPPIP